MEAEEGVEEHRPLEVATKTNMPGNTTKQNPFNSLPEDIKEWLSSEVITYEIGKLIDKIKLPENKERTLALLIGKVVLKILPANLFIETASKELNVPLSVAQTVGIEVKNSILKPISASLWKNFAINVEDLGKGPAQPAARVTKMDQPFMSARPQPKPPVNQPVAPVKPPEEIKPAARTMEFKQVADVKKPEKSQGVNIKPKNESELAPDVIPTPKPFGLSEVVPQAPKPPAVATPERPARPASQPVVPQPTANGQVAGDAGRAESLKKPELEKTPEHHELAEYHDDHPMKTG